MKLYDIYKQHPVICTDSRSCPPDSLFFALKGDNFDANSFALSALEKGCAYAVVDDEKYAVDDRFLLVNNTLEALQQLARHHRRQLGTKIIGITGTNGKTTTKELIASVIKQQFNTHFTQGNLNNHIGVPLTLLQLNASHQIAVIEMGASHRGEISMLAEIAEPDYGIITNVGKAHLEGFGSFEGVMQTKAELYTYIREHEGKIFLNTGNHYLKKMVDESGITDKHKIASYELDSSLEQKVAVATVSSGSPLLEMNCTTSQGNFDVKTQLFGVYNAENVLAAVTIGAFFGLSNEQIKLGLENYEPNNNRSQFKQTHRNKLIIDAYNANPTSMQAAIKNFATLHDINKTLIIGDMLELGDQTAEEHQRIVDLLSESGLSSVYLIGKHFQQTRNNYHSFENVAELKKHLQNEPIEGHFVLIKGSRGIQLEKVVDEL